MKAGLVFDHEDEGDIMHINSLLGNDRETNNETTAIAMQQLRKYATVLETLLSSSPRATLGVLLEAVCSMLSALSLYLSTDRVQFSVEAGSNTSIVNLRVVGGDEKGSLKSETVKYGHESYGTRTTK
jgi:hypothetical protein